MEVVKVLIDERDLNRLFRENPNLKVEKNLLYFEKKSSVRDAVDFKCPICKAVGLGEIKEFDDEGARTSVFICECGHEEVF